VALFVLFGGVRGEGQTVNERNCDVSPIDSLLLRCGPRPSPYMQDVINKAQNFGRREETPSGL
jgi:hypothetical protein